MADTFDSKPKSNPALDAKPINTQTFDEKPKGIIYDPNFNEDETINSVITVGAYAGLPFLIYTVAGTVTFTQPKGGRAG